MQPDERGYFGAYGGSFVPETLVPALEELTLTLDRELNRKDFLEELNGYLQDFAGRPTPLYHAANLSASLPGLEVYLKREDLAHTGAHKINNTLGQGLLARRMGKKRLIAETGAGQHGVATATVGALLNLETVVYMGAEDARRQAPNVKRMKLLGAEVREVQEGSATLKEATNEAIRHWVASSEDSHYIIGSVVGPHPYPYMVRTFQEVIGREAKSQFNNLMGKQPDIVMACVGGGSNALGIFHPFLGMEGLAEEVIPEIYGIEAAGEGLDGSKHAATLSRGSPGVLHGSLSYLLQDACGQVKPVHSISAGLDYPGVGPEHAFLRDERKVNYRSVTDEEARQAFEKLCRLEGIIPALESSHALAYLEHLSRENIEGRTVVVCLSGRGDKDLDNLEVGSE